MTFSLFSAVSRYFPVSCNQHVLFYYKQEKVYLKMVTVTQQSPLCSLKETLAYH